MSVTKETFITISITPKLLRRIAKEFEQGMETAKLGQYVPSHSFYMGRELTIKLQADQDAYHKRNESEWV